jgi:cation diffusion facilitator family transporter
MAADGNGAGVAGESKKTVLVAVTANATIATAKGIAGALSGSSALLAEAAHSVADTTNQLLLLVSIGQGEREPDEEHPFGYGKERFFWTLLAAVLIFLAGAVFSIGEGLWRLVRPSAKESFALAMGTIAFAFVAEGASFVRAIRQVRREAREAGVPLVKYIRQSKDPTVKAVLSEDATDLVGLTFAAAGVGLEALTGRPAWDAGAAILVGALLVFVAFQLGRDTKGLLIGEAAPKAERDRLRELIERHADVRGVRELLTMYVGPESLLVAARVDFDDDLRAADVERVATAIERELREAIPAVAQVFLDPTGYAGGIADTPGSSLPSSSSSEAPPPVETHETRSVRSSSRSARTESAPPTTE